MNSMHRLKILLVADDPEEQARLKGRIDALHETESAASIDETLHKVVISDPHLILVHLQGPDRDARALCRAIRGLGASNGVKILLAAKGMGIGERQEAYLSGADDLLPKPFSDQELNAKINLFSPNGQSGETDQRREQTDISQFASVIENTPLVAIKGFDIEGVITHWNKTCEQIYGYAAHEAIGRRPKDFFQDERAVQEFEDGLETIVETGMARLPKEWSIHTRTGEKRWLYSTMFPVFQRGVVEAVFCMDVDITRRIWVEEDRRLGYEKLRRALHGTIQAMALTVETRDPYTAGHMRRVAELAQFIAGEMGMSQSAIDAIRLAASLHDIGKISVPAEILSRPRKLSQVEFQLVQQHPQVGYDILKPIEFPWPLADIVLQHHECLDGSGYPQGLTRDEIMIEANIIMVADVVESISNHRPYRPSLGLDMALAEVREHRDVKYHPQVVDACLSLFLDKGYQFDH